MARYFAGNTLASFFRSSNVVVESTSSGKFDSAFVPNAIYMPTGVVYAESYSFSATGTVWTHCEIYTTDLTNGNPIITWYNGSTGVFRLYCNGAQFGSQHVVQCQYWNGSAWTNTGSTWGLLNVNRERIDVKIVLGSGFEVYNAGTLVASGSGWSGGGTTITKLRVQSVSAFSATYVSQVMVCDFDSRDSRYYLTAMNGNSATNTGGTGAYTDLSETVLDESTAEVISVSGNKMGQTWGDITVPSGYTIGAVCIGARGRIAGAITDGKIGIRSGGTNYSGSGKTYNTGYEPRGRIDETDPATSTAWTQSGFNAVETYLEAV